MEAAHIPARLLGELLVDDGLITSEELEEALAAQAESGKRLGEVLVERKLVSGPELTAALMTQFGVEMTTQEGFGAGLWGEIKRRHRDARVAEVGLPDPNYSRLEPANELPPDNLVVLGRPLDADADAEPAAERQLAADPLDVPATISEAATFAARLADADDALVLESAYRENAERDLEEVRAELLDRDARIGQFEGAIADQTELQGELDVLTGRLAEADEMIARETALREAAETEAADTQATLAELRGELDAAASSRLAEAEAKDASAAGRIAELEDALEQALAESARFEATVTAQANDTEHLAGGLAEADEAVAREAGLRQTAEQDLDTLRTDAAAREVRLAELERETVELTTELTDERMRYANSEEERAATDHSLKRERLARERVEAELFELRGELNNVVARVTEAEAAVAPPEEIYADYLVFSPGTTGYELSEHTGAPPEVGAVAELDGAEFQVVKIGRSPLPADPRRCAYLEAA